MLDATVVGSIPPVLAEEPTIRCSNINLIFKINLNINLTFDYDFSFRICLDSTEMFLQVIISPHTLQSLISTLLPRPVEVSSVCTCQLTAGNPFFQVGDVCCT